MSLRCGGRYERQAEGMTDEGRRGRWERAAYWPLMAVAGVFLLAYAWPILDPGIGRRWRSVLQALTWFAWACFVLDYAVRLLLSRSRRTFVKKNLFDLGIVVLPILRPLRLLRLVTLLSVLNRQAGGSLRGRVAVYVAGAAALLLFVASLAILDAERNDPDAGIRAFGDALWWSMATFTTVGYGDLYPVTGTGRYVAAGLMLAGVALLGVVTASFASWLIEKVSDIEEESQAATRRDVAALAAEVSALRKELTAGSTATAGGDGTEAQR